MCEVEAGSIFVLILVLMEYGLWHDVGGANEPLDLS